MQIIKPVNVSMFDQGHGQRGLFVESARSIVDIKKMGIAKLCYLRALQCGHLPFSSDRNHALGYGSKLQPRGGDQIG